jgi:hypothetical protein
MTYATLSKVKNRLIWFTIKREKRKKNKDKKEKKQPQGHTETRITTPPVPLERYRRDEFNNTKEGHRWCHYGDLLWCRWICLVKIFPTILVVSLLKLWCASMILFLVFSFLSPLSSQITRIDEIEKTNKQKKTMEVH